MCHYFPVHISGRFSGPSLRASGKMFTRTRAREGRKARWKPKTQKGGGAYHPELPFPFFFFIFYFFKSGKGRRFSETPVSRVFWATQYVDTTKYVHILLRVDMRPLAHH